MSLVINYMSNKQQSYEYREGGELETSYNHTTSHLVLLCMTYVGVVVGESVAFEHQTLNFLYCTSRHDT